VHVRVFLLTCVALLCTPFAFALDSDKRLTQYLHNSWRIQDGSAPAGMFAIAQTSDGYLWLASDSQGLYRFDGVRFLPWTVRVGGKTIKTIVNVYGDHAGGLWVLSEREILHMKGGVVTSQLNLDGLEQFRHISEEPDGSLWVVRGGNAVSDRPLCRISDSAVKCFGKSDGVMISPADSLLADGKGGFWLGGQTALVHWHGGVSETYPVEALKSNAGQQGIVGLARGPEGDLWVGILAEGRGLGLARLKEGAVKPFVTPTFDGSKVVVSTMLFDREGNLWVGTGGQGIFRVHGNVVDQYHRADGLSGDTILDLFEDREGLIWAVTTNGIDSFRDPQITTFSAREGLGADAVAGVLATRDGSIWVANAGSLDHIKAGVVSSIRVGGGLPGHQVASLLEDRSGKLWVGVDDGLYLFEQGHFRRLPEPNNRPLGMVVALTEDVEGNVWAECAGNPRKLVRIRDFRVREEFPASKIPPGHSLAPAPHGGIWIGTLEGDIALFRNGALKAEFPLNPGGDPYNREILPEADGSVFAGSQNGLVEWRNGKVHRMTTKNGLPCDSVMSFIKDRENRWWLHTGCGVVQFPDSELQRWRDNPEAVVKIRVYDVLDGARPAGGPSFNPAAYSLDGHVWFATGFVLEMAGPSSLLQKPLPAPTYVESMIIDRKEFTATDNLNLGPHLRDLQIDYTSPTFTIPQRVKFRYQLEPYDRDWHEAGTRRQAFYMDLPPRKYSFRVMAANSDGVWNESAAKLDFSVVPAYYQTTWFRVSCVIALFALLWALYQLRLRQVAQHFNMRLNERVNERTRIARDLHDTLLQSFHGVMLHFQAGINLLPDHPAEPRTAEARKSLEKAMHEAKHAIVEGREAIQGLRSSVVETNDLAMAMRTLGEDLAANSSSIAFQVNVEGTPRDLHAIVRDEIYRITGEAMRNAFRHAEAARVELEIHYDERRLRVRVRDDGKGIDAKLLGDDGREGHFGLHGMRERANLIGGKLTVWSELHVGTEVELSVPAPRAYTAASDEQAMSVTKKALAKLSGRGTVEKP
jgi:signal transduction histidine kinase/ligand-binding sensor domain-containing protein